MTRRAVIAPHVPGLELSLRPIEQVDRAFLCALYASTRTEELAQVPWSDEQKARFLSMQFEAQHAHYQQHYHDTSFELILLAGQPIGRLYLAHWPSELRIVDIALLPEYRGRGIGTAYLRAILGEAQRLSLPVRIHVEQFNPALTLYTRLGFRPIDTNGPYYFMEWSSASTA